MATCEGCAFFFRVPEGEDDFEPGKADCVTEHKGPKGQILAFQAGIRKYRNLPELSETFLIEKRSAI